MNRSVWTFSARLILGFSLVFWIAGAACGAPIQKVQGIITEVGEGFLWVQPDDQSPRLRFILRWKARFVPPKLPLKGDRVEIWYKDKEQGKVIYGINYLPGKSGSPSP